ncbi:hypothetical protein PybrP1_001314 [[Pythium] brassicae (nom. inval.)]|nr:hypothetical protein PybrP1_001314 [[Pythium] brassicae (nom. inval.)]
MRPANSKHFNVDDAEDFDDGTRARTFDGSDDDGARSSESESERAPAPSLRVRNWEAGALDSAEYAGKVVKRRDVRAARGEADEDSPDEDAMAAWSDAEPFGASDSEDDGDGDQQQEAESEDESNESDDGGDEHNNDDDDDTNDAEKLMRGFAKQDSAQLMSSKDSAKLVEKALHVRHQKILWERFLEVQIYTKRLLTTAKAAADAGAAEPSDTAHKAQAIERLYASLDAVARLQDALCTVPELAAAAATDAGTKKRKRSVDAAWGAVSSASEAALPQYNEVLNAYTRKTNLAGGSQAKKFKAVNQDILAQVDAVLADVQRVKRKAHAPVAEPSSSTSGGGATSVEEGDVLDELMYDDSDFYQQLLKEFIESGGGGGDGGALQPRIHRKKKKLVNRKASKGRQLRYTVHPKLENFMFPDPYPTPAVDVDELFRSLFGQVRTE